jgi:hypothetical protein
MRFPALVLVFFLLLAGTVACIDEVNFPLRAVTPRLVVEGLITNQKPPYKVQLTFTDSKQGRRALTEANGVSGAVVSIADDQGNSTRLTDFQLGTYLTTDTTFVGVVGRSYTLSVQLPDGRRYASKPEQLTAVPQITRVFYEVNDREGIAENAGINVFVDVQDPAETKNYYRWSAYGYSLRQSTGVCCDFVFEGCPRCKTRCWMRNDNLAANIMSDELINGNPIVRQFVYFSPLRTRGPHLVEVSQYSLTAEAYRFWQRYEEQRIRTGSILDPLPEPIEGNVANADNPNEVALGYFGASSLVRQRIRTDPFALDPDRILLYESIFLREGDCEQSWPGSEYDPGKPDQW